MPTTLAQRQAAYALLATAPGDARALRERITSEVDGIEKDDRWSPEHRGRIVAQAREQAAGRLATLRSQVSDAEETIRQGAEEMQAAGTASDPTVRLAQATERGQAWDRLRPQLEAGRPWGSLLADAEDSRDATSVLALADEVPSWIAARTGSPASQEVRDGLDRAVTRTLGDDRGRGSAGLLRAHLAARGPLAAAEMDWTAAVVAGRHPGMGPAIAVQRAQANATAVSASVEARTPTPAA